MTQVPYYQVHVHCKTFVQYYRLLSNFGIIAYNFVFLGHANSCPSCDGLFCYDFEPNVVLLFSPGCLVDTRVIACAVDWIHPF